MGPAAGPGFAPSVAAAAALACTQVPVVSIVVPFWGYLIGSLL